MSTKDSEQRAEYFEKLTGIKKPPTTLQQARKWAGISSKEKSDEFMESATALSELLRDLFFSCHQRLKKEANMKK